MLLLPDFEVIETEEQASPILARLLEQDYVAVDTETTGLSRWSDRVVCWSVSFEDPDCVRNTNRFVVSAELLLFFAPFFESDGVAKVFHNSAFDVCMLWNSGIRNIGGDIYCTLVMDAILDENRTSVHGLKSCAWDYLNLSMREYMHIEEQTTEELREVYDEDRVKELLKMKMPVRSQYFRLDGIFGDYASEDSFVTFVLFRDIMRPRAQAEVLGKRAGEPYTTWDLYNDHFTTFNRTIANMCIRGWEVDLDYLESLIPLFEQDIRDIDVLFNQYANMWCTSFAEPLHTYMEIRGNKHRKLKNVFPNGYVNPGSDVQVGYLLFNIMGYPIIKETNGGTTGKKRASLDESVLRELYNKHACNFAGLLLQRRKVQKVLGTYLKGLKKHTDPYNRIHAALRIMGAVTGRLSSSEPNLQNIPRPDKDPYRIRSAFIAGEGRVMVVADYNQLEMNVLAHMSGCETLCTAINSGRDLHCWTAEMMFGEYTYEQLKYAKDNADNLDLTPKELEELKPLLAQRTAAKAIGFGIMYGRGPDSLAETLGLMQLHNIGYREATSMAQGMIDMYLDTYQGVRDYMDYALQLCQSREYVQTWLLRKRRLISINSTHRSKRSEAVRQTLNSIIQGTASDIAMIAMNRIENDPELIARDAKLLMQIHDEVIVTCPQEHAEYVEKRVVWNMEAPFRNSFNVPITVSSDYAHNWADAK